jgi:beta-xylosidase
VNPVVPDISAPRSLQAAKSCSTDTVQAFAWNPELGNGRYRNPIIYADYSDPDVVRHGHDYYMTASSFHCTPGLPILHSRDLVNWQIINHAVQNLPHPRYERVQPGCGIWAPSLRFHDDRFWIFFPMPDDGLYVTTASDPAGEWSEPHLIQPGKGLIDPCPLWDDDGRAYLVHAYAQSRSGIKHCLRVCPMAPDASHLLGPGTIVFGNPAKQPTLEGPKFLKRNGWFYILAPAGGVASGWQTVLRSRNIFGPYEDKIVLAQGSTAVNGPHQGALVETAQGQWWFVHFQDAAAYGRITHLQPAHWQEDWPVLGVNQNRDNIGEPALEFIKPEVGFDFLPSVPQTSDEFIAPQLGLQWQWSANHRHDWYSLLSRKSWLRLFAHPVPEDNLSQTPRVLSQKFPAPEFSATTRLELPAQSHDTRAGLVVLGTSYAGLRVQRFEGVLLLEQFSRVIDESEGEDTVHQTLAVADGPLDLRVDVRAHAVCQFSYSADGWNYLPIGRPFSATPGKWIGAKVGVFATGTESHADFDYFRIEGRR